MRVSSGMSTSTPKNDIVFELSLPRRSLPFLVPWAVCVVIFAASLFRPEMTNAAPIFALFAGMAPVAVLLRCVRRVS